MANIYSTVDELEASWRLLTEAERERAEAAIADASILVESVAEVDQSDEHQMEVAGVIVRRIVKRAMANDNRYISDSMGIDYQAYMPDQVVGELRLYADDRDMLIAAASCGIGTAWL